MKADEGHIITHTKCVPTFMLVSQNAQFGNIFSHFGPAKIRICENTDLTEIMSHVSNMYANTLKS